MLWIAAQGGRPPPQVGCEVRLQFKDLAPQRGLFFLQKLERKKAVLEAASYSLKLDSLLLFPKSPNGQKRGLNTESRKCEVGGKQTSGDKCLAMKQANAIK